MSAADNRWTLLASAAHALSTVVQVVVERKKPESNDPSLHERVALLEKRVSDMEEKKAT